jgi:seryl-tRNA synthetase
VLKARERDDSDTMEGVEAISGIIQDGTDDSIKQKIKQRSSDFNQAKEELLRSRRAVQVLTGSDAADLEKDAATKQLATPLEQRRQKFIKRKKEFGDRSEDTMEKLKMFQNSIKKAKVSDAEQSSVPSSSSEHYNGQILERNDDSDDDLSDWNSGKLKFKKHIDDAFRAGDGRSLLDYEVIDYRDKDRKGETNNRQRR